MNFFEYMKEGNNAEMVTVGLDMAFWHIGYEAVFEESIKAGRPKDVEAMKYIIENKISINMFAKVG